MRQHPISPVTEPTQYRAIGVVRGRFEPVDPDQLTRGVIHTADGSELDAVVLGRLLTLMRRHLDLSVPHLWVVYPRCREEGKLHLQMVGVWEPSTLSPGEAEAITAAPAPESPSNSAKTTSAPATKATARTKAGLSDAPPAAAEPHDALPEGDDYFSVRGELIFTRPETGDLVVKVRQQPRADGSRPTPFKLQLRGEIPLEHLRHFVALDMRRQGQQLCLEHLDVLEPINQRGNRGGKSRRTGERGGRGSAGGVSAAGGAGSGGGSGTGGGGGAGRASVARRPSGTGPGQGRDHGRPISRTPR